MWSFWARDLPGWILGTHESLVDATNFVKTDGDPARHRKIRMPGGDRLLKRLDFQRRGPGSIRSILKKNQVRPVLKGRARRQVSWTLLR